MRDPQKPKGLKMFWAELAKAIGGIVASKASSNNNGALGTVINAYKSANSITNSAKNTNKLNEGV